MTEKETKLDEQGKKIQEMQSAMQAAAVQAAKAAAQEAAS